ncbi:hypothetical protein CQ046_17210 [Chryseobacterium sp. MYb7]|uniref:hypothetical protein n=1 Tax=Chryseobacterium sp. MYb7 TaxID=1827290 RepID=UPI000CFE68E9|nr:hypothetical protein [Chryseobacterium sp. MYb7]PRB00941.1 hypothetical protein CQ046_17210 [Chryseobacterium sp. MYb7]
MMKKNLKLLVSALGFIFLFYSCRTDEMVSSEQRAQDEKIGAFERFENLRSQEILSKENHSSKNGASLPLSYAQPFSEIIYQFLAKHPDFYDKLADDFGEIDYNVASQTFGEDKKYIFYPVLKDGKVTSLWYGKLKEDRTWVDFYLVHDPSASTQRMIAEFQNYYSKKAVNRGEPDPPVKEIPEIVITPPSTNPPINDPLPNTGGGGTYTPPYTGDMSGGPIMHGGGSGTSTTQDPCKKMKTLSTNANYKAKVDLLASKVGLKKETGFAESKSGVFTELLPAVSTENSDGMTVTVTSDLKGYIHTHLDDYDTGKTNEDGYPFINEPIRMFSPADVNTLMTMAEMASNGDYTDLYGTMVSSDGNYTIKFSGTPSDIKTGFDGEQWRIDYKDFIDKESGTLEARFLMFLKYKMNVKGIDLYKIKSNGTIQKKTLNSNNTVDSSDCPN